MLRLAGALCLVYVVVASGEVADAAAVTSSPGGLYQALLTTRISDSALPSGFFDATNGTLPHNRLPVTGAVGISLTPDASISYYVFRTSAAASLSWPGLRYVPASALVSSTVKKVGVVPGIHLPSKLFGGSVTGKNAFGATVTDGVSSGLALDGNVVVMATTESLANPTSGDVPGTVSLLNFAIKHLQTIEGGGASASSQSQTPSPTTTTTPVSTSTIGSRNSPIPIGQAYVVPDSDTLSKGWTFQVNSVTPDATAQVLATNQFNSPPASGDQFFMVNFTMTYKGSNSSNVTDIVTSLGTVGAANTGYTSFGNSCGVVPNELDQSQDVFTGGTITGNLCWDIASSDAASLILYFTPFLSSNHVFFALH